MSGILACGVRQPIGNVSAGSVKLGRSLSLFTCMIVAMRIISPVLVPPAWVLTPRAPQIQSWFPLPLRQRIVHPGGLSFARSKVAKVIFWTGVQNRQTGYQYHHWRAVETKLPVQFQPLARCPASSRKAVKTKRHSIWVRVITARRTSRK
jgi:hypothetical protein